MHYEWIEKKKDVLMILLHGTGGSVEDLIPFASVLDQEASILSLEGDVLEQGMKRFFKRLSMGVFDEKDLLYRSEKMAQFLQEFIRNNGYENASICMMGYSNGANMIASLLYLGNLSMHKALLLHAMVPWKTGVKSKLKQTNILLTAGNNDPIVPMNETKTLQSDLLEAGAFVDLEWFSSGHAISQLEINTIIEWYRRK